MPQGVAAGRRPWPHHKNRINGAESIKIPQNCISRSEALYPRRGTTLDLLRFREHVLKIPRPLCLDVLVHTRCLTHIRAHCVQSSWPQSSFLFIFFFYRAQWCVCPSAPRRWSTRWPAWTSHLSGKVALSHSSAPWDCGQTSQPVCSNCPASQPCTKRCWAEVRDKAGRFGREGPVHCCACPLFVLQVFPHCFQQIVCSNKKQYIVVKCVWVSKI